MNKPKYFLSILEKYYLSNFVKKHRDLSNREEDISSLFMRERRVEILPNNAMPIRLIFLIKVLFHLL